MMVLFVCIPRLKWERFHEGFLRFAFWLYGSYCHLFFLLLCWRIDGYAIFWWFEKRYFSERRGMCSFLVFSRCFCGRFCGVKIELWWSLWRYFQDFGLGWERDALCEEWGKDMWALAFSTYINVGLLIIIILSSVGLLVSHVVMRNRKTMV